MQRGVIEKNRGIQTFTWNNHSHSILWYWYFSDNIPDHCNNLCHMNHLSDHTETLLLHCKLGGYNLFLCEKVLSQLPGSSLCNVHLSNMHQM